MAETGLIRMDFLGPSRRVRHCARASFPTPGKPLMYTTGAGGVCMGREKTFELVVFMVMERRALHGEV